MILCYVMLLRYVTLPYIISYYIILYYIILYYIILYCIMLCYVILYYILLYEWCTKMYNNPNRRVQICCVIVQFETRLNRFQESAVSLLTSCFHEKWIKLFCIKILEIKRGEYFLILSYFQNSVLMFSHS